MRILPIIARIAAQCDKYKSVDVPTSLEPVDDLATTPVAFVYWVAEPSATRDVVLTSQTRTLIFGVMSVAQMPNAAANTEPLEEAREQLIANLVGWSPAPGHGAIEHSHAEIMDIRGDLVWVRDYFTTRKHQRSIN